MRRLLIEILPNTKNKSKWYYGSINKDKDLTGKQIIVKEHEFEFIFEGCYRYTDSLFIDKKDCNIIEIL